MTEPRVPCQEKCKPLPSSVIKKIRGVSPEEERHMGQSIQEWTK